MVLNDITLGQIMLVMGIELVIAFGIATILYLIGYIINWTWWKKENRKDFEDLRFFFNHRDEIKECIKKYAFKKRGEI